MYTRCPNCQTYFKISAEQLKKAGGKVRCGQCSKVFNSLGNLLEELPVALSDRGKVKPAPPPPKPATPPSKPAVAPTPSPVAPKPRPAPSVTAPVAPEPEPARAAMPAAPKPAVAPPKAAPAPKPEPVALTPEKAVSEDTIVFDGGEEKPLIFGDDSRDTLNLSSEDKVENVQTGPFSAVKDLVQYQAGEDIGGDSYSGAGNLFWGAGVAVLLLLFIFQYSYYMRDDLARYPELRPWIQTLCEIAQCELPLQQNIDLIKLTHRDITSHPRVKGALLINAIIVNNATFAQPFPAMQITLSDISGSVIAKRRFQPNEYLDADVNLRRGMPPNSPIQIGLEIADPGKDAVNFEFNFFYPNS